MFLSPGMLWVNDGSGVQGSIPYFGDNLGLDTIFGTPQVPLLESNNKILGKHAHVQYFYEGPKKYSCCITRIPCSTATPPQPPLFIVLFN
jgi:hypothetical protein